MDYLIAALPRSRTAWLANLLTYGPSRCLHEPFRHGLDAAIKLMDRPGVGCADTGAALVLDQIKPAKLVVIRRDLEDVRASLEQIGVDLDSALDEANVALSRARPGLCVDFDDLDDACEAIWEYCVGGEFDVERFEMLRGMKVVIR